MRGIGPRWRRALVVLVAVFMVLPMVAWPVTGRPPAGPAAAQQPAKPNIVLIVADDLDPHLFAEMLAHPEEFPNLTALNRRAVSFSNYIVNVASCCPSRASMLLGQYAHNHGILVSDGGFTRFTRLHREKRTINRPLKAAGYRTALVGKYLNGYQAEGRYVAPGWDRWYATDSQDFFDYLLNENGRPVSYGRRASDYLTDVLARKASQFIRETDRGRPFFLYLNPKAPHVPATPAPRHRTTFTPASLTLPSERAAFDEEDVSDKPTWVARLPRLSRQQQDEIDALYLKRLRSMLAVDDMLGRLNAVLKDTGRLDNTYIIFTSDNGWQAGEHRLAKGKGVPYEESIRMPLLVQVPGVDQGRSVDALVTNADLAPTIADLAGTKPTNAVDARSFVTYLGGGGQSPDRQAVLLEGYMRARNGRITTFYTGLRTQDAVYVEYGGDQRELYDLEADPSQLANLANQAAYEAIVNEYSGRLAELRSCRGTGQEATSCAAIEDRPLSPLPPSGAGDAPNQNPDTAPTTSRVADDADRRPDARPDRRDRGRDERHTDREANGRGDRRDNGNGRR